MNACRKNDEYTAPSIEQHNIKSKPTFEDVVNFSKMAIEDNDLSSRSLTYYSLADGNALLEESLNFTYCRPDTVYLEYDVFIDTIFIPVETTNEIFGTAKWFTNEKLDDAFDEISNRAGEYFGGLSGSDKEPIQFGLRLKNYGTAFSGDTIEVHYFLISGIGYENSLATSLYDNTDFWYWASEGGKCGEYSGQTEWGAASIFQRDLRRELIPRRVVNRHFYFTDPETTCFHLSGCGSTGIPDIQADNDYGFSEIEGLLFSNTNPCLSPIQMNQFFNSMKDDLIGDYAPTDKYPSSILVGYDVGFSYVHQLLVFYSKKALFVPIPNFPIPLTPL